jgi:hypothetical protein
MTRKIRAFICGAMVRTRTKEEQAVWEGTIDPSPITLQDCLRAEIKQQIIDNVELLWQEVNNWHNNVPDSNPRKYYERIKELLNK